MTTPAHLSRRSLLGLAGAGAGAAFLSACGGGGSSSGSGDSVIDWWHISTGEPMKPVWAKIAKDWEAKNAGTTVKITPLENEAFKSKLTTVTQAGNPPDVFQTWGGGVLKQQADAGLVQDLTDKLGDLKGKFAESALAPYTIDGKLYAMPYDTGMIGFWYNKALFAKAGIAAPPATWAEFLDAVRKLKASGTTPIALAGKDKWPGHYYWAYLAMRIGGVELLQQAGEDGKFDKPEFVQAGERLKELVDLQPFQKGFMGAEYGSADGQAAEVGNRKAAMELMGQWAPSVQADAAKKPRNLGGDLDFFPFPAVDGGKGKSTDAFGGGGGFAIGKNAPAKAVDFLKFLETPENATYEVATGAVLPVIAEAQAAVKDPLQKKVAEALAGATGFQLYLDQAYAPAVGQQVNDSVAELMAGKASPQQVAQEVTEVAGQQ
jgi:raffinose/stachyose/melibiose transport system substrate-binding protein